jgi:hypothetical protein
MSVGYRRAKRRIVAGSAVLAACALWVSACAMSNALEGEGGSGAGSGSTMNPLVPCFVADIVSQHCTTCHASPPRYGAPMSLMTAANFHGRTRDGAPIHQRALQLVKSSDPDTRMPPPGTVAGLNSSELDMLSIWLEAEAPPDPRGCPICDGETGACTKPPPASGGAGGEPGVGGSGAVSSGGSLSVGGGSGVGGLGGAGAVGGVSGGVGGIGGVGGVGAGGSGSTPPASGAYTTPYAGWDAGVECYKFIAHNGDKTSKYSVPTTPDTYTHFSLMPPWTGTRYVRAFRKIIDNTQVIHHWLLFQEPGSVTDGQIQVTVGLHPTGQLMHGWAPGGMDIYFTPDIGMEVDAARGYILENHYNNTTGGPAPDGSGVEVCVTAEKPPNVASLSWVGTDGINGTTATGTCRPKSPAPAEIHILAGTPHMHVKGRHMKVVLTRANGTQEVVHDEDFAFENQRIYPEDIILRPGDFLTTTCTYSSPAQFGPSTNQEMCYWFANSYPAGALADGLPVGTFVHGANSCLGS